MKATGAGVAGGPQQGVGVGEMRSMRPAGGRITKVFEVRQGPWGSTGFVGS